MGQLADPFEFSVLVHERREIATVVEQLRLEAKRSVSQIIGRVDYARSEKHNLYGRYFIYDYTGQAFFDGKNALSTGPNPGNRDRSMTATFGDTYTFGPSAVNSFQ